MFAYLFTTNEPSAVNLELPIDTIMSMEISYFCNHVFFKQREKFIFSSITNNRMVVVLVCR